MFNVTTKGNAELFVFLFNGTAISVYKGSLALLKVSTMWLLYEQIKATCDNEAFSHRMVCGMKLILFLIASSDFLSYFN